MTLSPGGAPAAYGGGSLNIGLLTPCGCGPACVGVASGTGSRGREAAFSLGPVPKPKSVMVVGGALTLVLGFGGSFTETSADLLFKMSSAQQDQRNCHPGSFSIGLRNCYFSMNFSRTCAGIAANQTLLPKICVLSTIFLEDKYRICGISFNVNLISCY